MSKSITMTHEDLQAITAGLVEGVRTQRTATQTRRSRSTFAERQAAFQTEAAKSEALMTMVGTHAGLNKIAADLANPVRFFMDYKAIARQLVVTEQIPDGVPMIYDRDLPQVPTIIAGEGGMPGLLELTAVRVEIQPFEIMARPKLPYRELYIRRYKALERLKDRLIEGIDLREDLKWFSLLDTASTLINTPVNVVGKASKDDIADAMYQVERHRLPVVSVLADPLLMNSIRSLQFQDLDQQGMQEVRETGYMGTYNGMEIFISDQVTTGRAYFLAPPKFCGWQPIRKDTEIIPADDPDQAWLGFLGYLLEGMTWFGAYGATQMNFTI
jgi:hypothetical protein